MIHNLLITLESVNLAMEAHTMIFLYDQQYEHPQLSRLVEGIEILVPKKLSGKL
jgi:hypothetical protein